MEFLIIQKLSKMYKQKRIVNNTDLYLHSGEIVGLLGPNGSGKTTTFQMILGIVLHDSGKIFLNETDISQLPTYARARLGIGFLPQDNSIFRKLTVFDNLMAIAQMNFYSNKNARYEHIINLMKNFNIQHLSNNIGESLSGGERKRVEIARALVAKPKFLLLDEPFAGVDPISIKEIQKIIKQLKHYKLGILITDHNVQATLSICERAYVMNQGTLIAHGTSQEILNNKHVQKTYLGNLFPL
ncbi:ABC transporter [Candidatus Blochmanniella vafra str. BVAF]|uniref:Lipopolysaccharide export system ATP-binding protein LptB n=1 Tax=Blochmanniella vafra (strain BVAF) TaxID=859654 RepID=E8Q6L4_BLOVB|nr:LPS export ABC transporter ATP-binding protein [Candidatus Blochmannia vafer]ADV33455.1 ABC transporter [Candidatus Blochmannia vafer str. BVAF]